ncbi:MAG: hypothetical protein U9Q03_02610 [Patescibacteria group bacterium]|nr:hypothetical protein [Patescibacteria group bacterium]
MEIEVVSGKILFEIATMLPRHDSLMERAFDALMESSDPHHGADTLGMESLKTLLKRTPKRWQGKLFKLHERRLAKHIDHLERNYEGENDCEVG